MRKVSETGHMNLTDIFRIWRKRWLSTTALILMALAATGYALHKIPRTYQAQSTVVLLASRNYSKVNGEGNPYLSFNVTLSDAADALSNEVMSPQTALDLASRGLAVSYSVTSESTSSQTLPSSSTLPGPFILVTVTGHNAFSVEATLTAVTKEINTKLDQMQSHISAANKISVNTLSFTPHAELSFSQTARSLVLIVIPLAVLALALPLIADSMIAHRRRKRAERIARRSTSSEAKPAYSPPAPRVEPHEAGRTSHISGIDLYQPRNAVQKDSASTRRTARR
jgi:hypothetical protein